MENIDKAKELIRQAEMKVQQNQITKNVGDIIVFRNRTNDTLTIHRIAKLGESTVTTKGDANFREDTSVSYADVIGKTVTIGGKSLNIPYLGSITVFASSFK